MAVNRRLITQREIELGDCVSLNFPDIGWDMCKAIRIDETTVTVMRPWMSSSDTYPMVGFEMVSLWRDSDKTVTLVDRVSFWPRNLAEPVTGPDPRD